MQMLHVTVQTKAFEKKISFFVKDPAGVMIQFM